MVIQDELNAKLKYHYDGCVVNKKLSQRQEIIRLPRFVSEFLLTKLSGYEDDREKFSQELTKIIEYIDEHYPEPRDKDKILNKLLEQQIYVLIDEFRVEVDIKNAIKKAHIPSLNIRDAMILDSILKENENLLSTGIWGVAGLRYADPIVDEFGNKLTSPVLIENFKPFQAPNVNLNDFAGKREKFTMEEWIDVLINTIGLNPEVFNEKQKLILISRFIPLVEPNVCMMEFGPRASGKTYFYRNISFHTRIISGGRVSPAVLFYNIGTRTMGEIGIKDSIVFDEVAKIGFANADEMMGKLKDFMESAHFERGPKKATSLCSLVFMGNVDVKGFVPIEDFTYVLPEFMRDSAFIDRINGLIPGWELPKIKKPEIHLSQNYGFSVDYFSEILHELRRRDFQTELTKRVSLENVTIRDYKGIYKLLSGMIKILFPHRKFSDDELRKILNFCIEYRQSVAEWLHKLAPGEFERKTISYQLS
jgi:ATP-dependent Lon protease